MKNYVRIVNYRGHVIYMDTDTMTFLVALKRDRTDSIFATYDDAVQAIDKIEDNKQEV